MKLPHGDGMTENVVHEWLADYGALSPVEVHSFASSLEHDQNVVAALYNVLEERNRYQELIDPVCTQLFGFYRSREVELQRFTLQFLPTLIYVYLNSVSHGDKKNCRSVETLLIGLYNLEVVDEHGQPKVVSFRLPSLAQASIYHEPMSLAPASLTESALRRLEECNTKLVNWGPLPQVEGLNAQNRLKVMTALLFVYNRQLSLLHKSALKALCKVASKLVTQGFPKPGHHHRSSYGSDTSYSPRLVPRIPVSSQFLLEFMHAVYYALFNEFGYLATPALEDVYNRACYEGYADVVLVSSAIRHSLQVAGQPCDGPMGISVALSPATTTVTTVSKSMITNASFRTKKLPDDIPIQTPKDDGAGEGKSLMAISEEQEETPSSEKLTPRGSSLRGTKDSTSSNSTLAGKGLPKLPTFPGLGKKAKDKDAKSSTKNGITPEKKETDSKKADKAKDGSKALASRGPLVNVVVVNGDSTEGESPAPPIRKKTTENSSADTSTNGGISAALTIEMEKMGIGMGDSQSTNNTVIIATSDGGDELETDNAMDKPHKKLEVDRLSMQVSSV